jgi:hypothetical protein
VSAGAEESPCGPSLFSAASPEPNSASVEISASSFSVTLGFRPLRATAIIKTAYCRFFQILVVEKTALNVLLFERAFECTL